jgi:hypothetical protein
VHYEEERWGILKKLEPWGAFIHLFGCEEKKKEMCNSSSRPILL